MTELLQQVTSRLSDLEAERGFRILHAVESGSRAWGFASQDSDYDVRFIYVWPKSDYLRVREVVETLDWALDDNDIDLSGWELRKALRLFCRSNGALLEWLHSPVVYRSDRSVMNRWRSLVPSVLCPRRLASHYGGLSRRLLKSAEDSSVFTAKRYLYILRGLLAGHFAASRHAVPPVEFAELMSVSEIPAEIRNAISVMIAAKSGTGEKDTIGRSELIETFIGEELSALNELIESLPTKEIDYQPVDEFFRSVVDQ